MNWTISITEPAIEPLSLYDALSYLGITPSVSTTLSSAASADDTTISVASATGLAVGQTITIGSLHGVISAISGTTITIPALAASVASGSAVTYSSDNATVLNALKASRRQIEAYLNRALITQTIVYQADSFPGVTGGYALLSRNSHRIHNFIKLPRPKLQSITSILYYDSANTENTFSSSSYSVDTLSEPGRIFLNSGYSWPTSVRDYAGVKITYLAGYGATASSVPSDIVEAIKLQTAYNFEAEAMPVSSESIGAISFSYGSNADNGRGLSNNVKMLVSYLRIDPAELSYA